jgi:hypothetical protein
MKLVSWQLQQRHARHLVYFTSGKRQAAKKVQQSPSKQMRYWHANNLLPQLLLLLQVGFPRRDPDRLRVAQLAC